MILLGLLLVAVAVAAAVILIVQNAHTITVHVFNSDYSVSAYWLALAGLAIMAVLALGLWAIRAGMAHRWRLRRERRELVKENRRLSERETALRERIPDQNAAGRAARTETVNTGTSGTGGAGATSADAGRGDTGRPEETFRSRVDESGRIPPQER